MPLKSPQVQPRHSGIYARDHPEMDLGASYAPVGLTPVSFSSRHNSHKTIVYNQCVNELLWYTIKSYHGILEEDRVPKDIYDNARLPLPPQPGDINVIMAGFSWCVYTLQVMQTDKTMGIHQPASLPLEHISEGKRYQE